MRSVRRGGSGPSSWMNRAHALTRHQQWCAAEDLIGPTSDEQRSQLTAEAATELDHLNQARGRNASDAA